MPLNNLMYYDTKQETNGERERDLEETDRGRVSCCGLADIDFLQKLSVTHRLALHILTSAGPHVHTHVSLTGNVTV